MHVILFYDVNKRRVNKMLKLCRRFLTWIQESAFEGEITEANLKILTEKINKIIVEKDCDSVIVYKLRTLEYTEKIILGSDKKQDINII